MKKMTYFLSFMLMFVLNNSLSAQTTSTLDAVTYAAKLKQTPAAQLIDVRTSAEFAQGHIANAKNLDINADDFQERAAKLDKNKAVFVYCLSGGRSSHAMNVLNSMGFKEVYNLSGGLMRWRAANMPETTDTASAQQKAAEMTLTQYQALLKSDKLVLIDFYADWCPPCKKMKPYLEEISKEMKAKVVLVRIDADANKTLAKALKIETLPVLLLYKAGKQIWTNNGYVSKEEVVKKLKAN